MSTQLSGFLAGKFGPPRPDISRAAQKEWEEYQICLSAAKNTPTESSDALEVSAESLTNSKSPENVKRGFGGLIDFWSNLTKRRPNGKR